MTHAYNAALICDTCAEETKDELQENGVEDNGDTDTYPQFVSPDEEHDSFEFCDQCGCLLEVRLSRDGLRELRARVIEEIQKVGNDSLYEAVLYYEEDLFR